MIFLSLYWRGSDGKPDSSDIKHIIKYYGLDLVQDVTLRMLVLNPKRVNLLSLLWDIPVEQFKAWNTRDWEKIYGGFLEKRNSF